MRCFLCILKLGENCYFLLGDNGNEIDYPQNSEEVARNNLKNSNNYASCITLANTNKCSVNIVKDNEKKLCNKGEILKSLSEFLHKL